MKALPYALYAVLLAAALIGVLVPVVRETAIGVILASLLFLEARKLVREKASK